MMFDEQDFDEIERLVETEMHRCAVYGDGSQRAFALMRLHEKVKALKTQASMPIWMDTIEEMSE